MTSLRKPETSARTAGVLIADLRSALAECPEPPWFAADDPAEDTIPHRNSGLALVDTGRTGDGEWPIARLCEWNTARFIAACGEGVPALLAAYDADRALIASLVAALREVERETRTALGWEQVNANLRVALSRADAQSARAEKEGA